MFNYLRIMLSLILCIYTVFRLSFTFLMCDHSNTIKCYETNILPTNYKYMNIYFLNPLFAIHC